MSEKDTSDIFEEIKEILSEYSRNYSTIDRNALAIFKSIIPLDDALGLRKGCWTFKEKNIVKEFPKNENKRVPSIYGGYFIPIKLSIISPTPWSVNINFEYGWEGNANPTIMTVSINASYHEQSITAFQTFILLQFSDILKEMYSILLEQHLADIKEANTNLNQIVKKASPVIVKEMIDNAYKGGGKNG